MCNRIKFADGEYYIVPLNHVPGTIASHGFCPKCCDKVLEERRKMRGEK
jgi:hypothetical protein